jgi:hypothetical protein
VRAARRSLSSQLAVRFVHETHIAPRRFDDSTAAFRQVPPRHRSRSLAQPRTQAQGKTASAHGQREGCLAVRTRVRGRTRGGTRRRCTFHSSPAYIGRNDARESCRVRSVWPRRRPRNERRPRVVVWRANGRDPTRIRDVREGHRVAPRVRGEGSAAARVAAVFRLGSCDGREMKNLDGDTPNSTRPAVPTISRKPTTPGVTCDKTGTRRGTGRAMRRNGRQFRRRRRRGRRSSQRTAKKHHKHKPRNPQSPRRAAPASSANKTLQSTSARRTWTRLTSLVTASF